VEEEEEEEEEEAPVPLRNQERLRLLSMMVTTASFSEGLPQQNVQYQSMLSRVGVQISNSKSGSNIIDEEKKKRKFTLYIFGTFSFALCMIIHPSCFVLAALSASCRRLAFR